MNDHHHHRHQQQHQWQPQKRRPVGTTTTRINSLTSGAAQVSRSRTIAPMRSHAISLATMILNTSWLLALVQIVRGEMALTVAANQSSGAPTTFLGPILISSAQSVSLGPRQPEDHQRHPRNNQSLPPPQRLPATRAPVTLLESASLEAPPSAVIQLSSEHVQQSEWRQDTTTRPAQTNFTINRQPTNGLKKKRDLEVEAYAEPLRTPPPRKSLPQAHIAPTQHGTFTLGPRGKRPDRKKLEELKPEDDVSKYLFKNFVPRWMDACNRRPDRNDTIIRMYVSTWSPRSADDIEAEILEFGTHPNVTRLRGGQHELRRRKRAIVTQVHEHLRRQRQQVVQHHATRSLVGTTMPSHHQHQQQQQQQVYSFQASQKSTILFKSEEGIGHDKKHWRPKKTTFNLSPMKFTKHHNQLSQAKNRFYTGQPGDILTGTTSGLGEVEPTTTTQPPEVVKPPERSVQITAITNDLFHLNTRMSWQIFGSLTTIQKLRNNLKALNDTIEADKRRAEKEEPDVSDTRRAEILESRKRWFPRYEDLVTTIGDDDKVGARLSSSLYNITGGLYKPQLRQLYANMTEYLQFFGVAFEQMKFDQQYFYKRDWDHDERYRLVDRQLQEILCETENYLRLDREFHLQREEYLRLSGNFKLAPLYNRGLKSANHEQFYARFINNSLHRDRPYAGRLVIESPIAKAFDRLEPEVQTRILRKLDTFLPENRPPTKPLPEWLNEEDLPTPPIVRRLSRPTHLWREIMPLEQRQLYTLKERAIRDQSIIQELPLFLKSLESLLSDNYATL